MKRIAISIVIVLVLVAGFVPATVSAQDSVVTINLSPATTIDKAVVKFVEVSATANMPVAPDPDWYTTVGPTFKVCVTGAKANSIVGVVVQSINPDDDPALIVLTPKVQWAGLDDTVLQPGQKGDPRSPLLVFPVKNECYSAWVVYKGGEHPNGQVVVTAAMGAQTNTNTQSG